MKRLTKMLIGLSVLVMLMVCMTAVSFAGTANDKVTVKFRSALPDKFVSITDSLEVTGDLVETNFPDIAKYEPAEGVSFLDAVVADNIRLYGADKVADYLAMADGGSYAWISKAYGVSLLASIIDGKYASSNHDVIKDGADLTALLYDDADWNKTFSYFDKAAYTATAGKPFEVEIKATSYGTDYPVDSAELAIVNKETGALTKLETEFKDGKATAAINEEGTFTITAVGKVTYNSYGSDVTTDYMGALAEVTVDGGKEATVAMRALEPGKILTFSKDLVAKSSYSDVYFPEIAGYEPEEPSFIDAVIADHIKLYGADKVKDNLAIADGGSYAWVSKAYGVSLLGSIGNKEYLSSNNSPVKDGDDLAVLLYSDGDWNKTFSYFDKDKYTATVGTALTINIKAMSYGTDYVPDDAVIQTIDTKTLALTDLATTYKDGKATVKFTKAGTYTITASGKVTYDGGYGQNTTDYMGALATVTVKDATPAKPVIKSAKRKTKTKAVVTWKKAKNAKKYEVAYRKAGAKKWTVKKATKTKITLKLNAKKKYQVKVLSVNGTAKSKYSKTKTIKVKK